MCAAPAAQAKYGVKEFDVTFNGPPAVLDDAKAPRGTLITQAGAHPFEMNTSFELFSQPTEKGGAFLEEPFRELLATQMPGFAGAPTAVPTCSLADFLTPNPEAALRPNCPAASAVGYLETTLASDLSLAPVFGAAFNVEAGAGEVSRLGFWVTGVPVTVDVAIQDHPPYRIVAGPRNTSQLVEVISSDLTLWGVPADLRHDDLRGLCIATLGEHKAGCNGHVSVKAKPFLTMPRTCAGPLATDYFTRSWLGATDSGSVPSHDEYGNPQGMSGCDSLFFSPEIDSKPTARAASSPSGLDFSLRVPDEGISNPAEGASAGSDIEKTVVALPEGMTLNPSQAEGLEVCSEADLARETASSAPGQGCPEGSRIGTIEVETPLLEGKLLKGSLFVAEPYRNLAGDSLIAVYVVIKDPALGILVKQPLEVTPDPSSGRLLATAEDMPQLPFSHFRLHFREGARAPLISPPGCGDFTTEATLYPRAGGPPVTSTSDFQIISGHDNSPCPAGAPFDPGFEAGTLDNAAGRYSPFEMRLTRGDGEQDMGRFSFVLPPGVVPKLAGIPYCPEAAIAQARSPPGRPRRTGRDRRPLLPGGL